MNSFKAILSNLIVPFFILSISVGIVSYSKFVPELFFNMLPYLFYALSAIVLAISWHFNRTKFIFVTIALLLVEIGLNNYKAVDATTLYLYSSILFPLHLLFFLILRERGLFSFWGVPKILFFLFEIAGVLYLINYQDSSFHTLFDLKLFSIGFEPLKDIAVAVALLVFFTIIALVMFSRDLIYSTSFLALHLSFFLGLYFGNIANATEMAFFTSVIIMLSLLVRELYRLAFYDELTSLPGRRALVEDMAKLGRTYSLAMCDIDFFKKFNDTYGHDVGDDALQLVASLFAEVGSGKAYRYGGEEFVILFPSKGIDEAYIYSDLLRQKIASTPFTVRNKKSTKKIFINISAGVVENKADEKDPLLVMKRADNALYKAKKAGRNQVVKA